MRRVCAYEPCGKPFVASTHNQKYDSPECCRLATNAKIMEKYHERKARRNGKERGCLKCGSPLSRYNEASICNKCKAQSASNSRKEILEVLGVIGAAA